MPKLNPSKCKLSNLKTRHFPLLRLSKCLLLASIAAIGVQVLPAYSYGDEVHKGIIEKAIELLRKNSSAFDRMSASEIARFQVLLEEGAMYADYGSFSNPPTGIADGVWCTWDHPFMEKPEKQYCDTIHHYAKRDVIESYAGVNIANPGQLTANVYAQELFNLAVRFYPNNPSQYLDYNVLRPMDGGYVEAPHFLVPEGDRIYYKTVCPGGYPLCLAAKNRPCPSWPSWIDRNGKTERVPQNASYSARYLGWALHMLADLTVPYHVANDATEFHVRWEDEANKNLAELKPALQSFSLAHPKENTLFIKAAIKERAGLL